MTRGLTVHKLIQRRIFLPIFLLAFGISTGTALKGYQPIKIECSLLESLDKFKMINTRNIAEFNRQLSQTLHSRFTAPDGSKFDLAELALLEEQGSINPLVSQKIKQAIIARVILISGPYLHDIRHHKATLVKIVEKWIEQRGFTTGCLLTAWSAAEPELEEELLIDRLQNLRIVHTFLVQLHDFLSDLIYSCPLSREFHTRHTRDKGVDTCPGSHI